MFDAQCDLAALVYSLHEDPDEVLRGFVDELTGRDFRVVGLIQSGHHCVDAPQMSATMIHTGETLRLFGDFDQCPTGCRLDVGELANIGKRLAGALDEGADLLVVNRFGKQELAGGGLSHLIERALRADIPVVVAVPHHRFANWIDFADGMSVKLPCDRESLGAWWDAVSARDGSAIRRDRPTFCEIHK